jgi:hypothetical protein
MTVFLVALIIILQAADIATTVRALKNGGTEINPIARKLFGFMGVIPAAVGLKLVGSIPMIALAALYPQFWFVPAAYAFALAGLVASNVFSATD